MCTYIVEKTPVSGSGKGAKGWFPLSEARVCYDHPFHASMDHSINIDFVNESQGLGARVAVELSTESAKQLVEKILVAIEIGERERALAG